MLTKLDQIIDADVEGSVLNKLHASMDDLNEITGQLALELNASDQAALMFRLHRVIDNVNGMTAALRTQVDAGGEDSLVGKVIAALDELDTSLVHIRQMVEENRPQIAATLEQVAAASRTLNEDLLSPLASEFDREDATSLLAKIHESMESAAQSLRNVEATTETGKRILVVNRPAIDRTIMNLKETSDQLRTIGLDIVLNPWRLIAPAQEEQQRMEVFQAAQLFAQAATQLDDVTARLAALRSVTPAGEQNSADAEELTALRTALDQAFERLREAEEFLWERLK